MAASLDAPGSAGAHGCDHQEGSGNLYIHCIVNVLECFCFMNINAGTALWGEGKTCIRQACFNYFA